MLSCGEKLCGVLRMLINCVYRTQHDVFVIHFHKKNFTAWKKFSILIQLRDVSLFIQKEYNSDSLS